MDSISRVLQRIDAIEQRFNKPAVTASGFSTLLSKAEQADKAPSQGNSTTSEIAKMVQVAAQKYGVDPKLALAVAKTESNMTADAVSSAGAVGVMQLMPETARAMGVRNIYDPRENIDGGVKYLKQMLTTFNGDIEKSVAAYNAGPSAVTKYAGVPPYSETQAYVGKVLALYS